MEKKLLSTSFKKWLPVAGLVILTVALILFFKKKNIDEIVTEQGENIASFYTQNLKPLFSRSTVSKEDVYDFAFNNLLPLDKSNKQYFKLSDVNDKNNYFEFRNASEEDEQNTDLTGFEENLGLSKKQKIKMDSILESYSKDLEKQILVNDKNTIAINYDLWDLNKAIKADVFRYLAQERVNRLDKVASLYSTLKDNRTVDKMIAEARNSENDKFIFITPDTIFSSKFRFNERELKKKAEEINAKTLEFSKKMDDVNKKMNVKIAFNKILPKVTGTLAKQNIRVKLDNNSFRVEIPDVEIPEINLDELKDLKIELAELDESLKPYVDRPGRSARVKTEKRRSGGSSSYSNPDGYELDIPLPDVGEIINQSLNAVNMALSTSGISEDFADSLAEFINESVEASMNDSMTAKEKAEFKKGMEEMKKELRKLKYQKKDSN